MSSDSVTPVGDVLKQFASQSGCEKYKTDSDKIRLLCLFLWVRRLDPLLVFEKFLERFTPLADYDEENRKHPDDMVRYCCPRTKEAATKASKPQWTAKQVSGVLQLYIDVVREAERQQMEPPLTLGQFLEQLGEEFRSGAFNVETPPTGTVAKSTDLPGQLELPMGGPLVPADAGPSASAPTSAPTSEPASVPAAPMAATNLPKAGVRPTAAGQACVITLARGRLVRGTVAAIGTDPKTQKPVIEFTAEDGSIHKGIAINKCEILDGAVPVPPGPVVARAGITLSKPQTAQAIAALELTQPMGNIAAGDGIYAFSVGFAPDLEAHIQIVNGETGPFVDAFFGRQNTDTKGFDVIADLPPRKVIEGEYHFSTPMGVYCVAVRGRA